MQERNLTDRKWEENKQIFERNIHTIESYQSVFSFLLKQYEQNTAIK